MKPLRSRIAPSALLAALLAGCVHPYFVGAPETLSAGSVWHGFLRGGVAMPLAGPGFEVHPITIANTHRWGTPRLVNALQRAGRTVQRRSGGVALQVGDLSRRFGGHLPPHQSHRNGRDVDLLFYALDAEGNPVRPPSYVSYDDHGRARRRSLGLQFDVVRNWQLVEALITDERAGVIRIFCATWLRRLLLTHAERIHRDSRVIERAALLLLQPRDSSPHDNHFHVRIACAPEERAYGCEDSAELPWWLEKDFGRVTLGATVGL